MNKQELIQNIKDRCKTKYSIRQIREILETLNTITIESLSEGEEVTFKNLGTFSLKFAHKESRKPAHFFPIFKFLPRTSKKISTQVTKNNINLL